MLAETARRSQERAKDLLDDRGLRHQTFIAGNELYVWAGDLSTAQALATLPEVAFIRATRTYYIDPVVPPDPPSEPAPQALAWGIVDTNADDFWTQFGVQGDGILVANIDTGVQWNHPALDQAFRCPGQPSNPACWADPSNICGGSACDNNGHGTHVMGTMVGDDDPSLPYQAGMAPDAQWIACKGCESSSCSTFALNACADWILAPGGSSANRPHVVNNSWGGAGCDTWYQPKVQAWRAAGIFPAFSAGNSGPSCSTLGSPGIYQESFGSAAHNSSRNIASFSSRGPAPGGSCPPYTPYTKPNISAPGVNICSSVPTNSWSCSYSGTSMASPHSAGAVALLWSCNSSLIGQINQTFEILQNNADTPPAGNCGAPPAPYRGNYTYGYGYLNVLAAGQAACGILQAPTLYDPGEYSTSGNYTVDWTDVTGADSYLLQEDDNPSFSSPTEYTTSSSQYSFTGKADGYYYYRVAAKKGSQTSPWSNTVDIIVDKTPPSNPSSVWSTSHTPYTWSSDNTIDVSWSGAWDNLSGVYGYSIEWNNTTSYYSVYAFNSAGTTAPGLYVYGTSYFAGSKSGYVADICISADDEPLEQGDVVVVVGYADPVMGEIPVMRVRKATEAYATGVVGVVDVRQVVEEVDEALESDPTATQAPKARVHVPDKDTLTVRKGEYLLVVTLGAYKAIKVDASYGPIRPGDLLVSSPRPGYAMRAKPTYIMGYPVYPSGTIIGKALGSLEKGTGVIPVLVILQ